MILQTYHSCLDQEATCYFQAVASTACINDLAIVSRFLASINSTFPLRRFFQQRESANFATLEVSMTPNDSKQEIDNIKLDQGDDIAKELESLAEGVITDHVLSLEEDRKILRKIDFW